jgi:hypothetical protein
MQVFNYQEKANDFSVPFDWDAEDYNIDYLVDEIAEKFLGERESVGNAWRPTFFGLVNLKQKLGDLGSLVRDDIIIMSQKAVDTLRPLIQASVELLPYKTEVGLYYLVNVLDEGDYLDRAQTECDRILPNGLCAGITRFVFDANKLKGKHIFRIPDRPTTRFISGEFVAMCRQHGLQGIELTDKAKLWEDEEASPKS